MRKRKLGQTGPLTSSIALGTMGMSDLYGGPRDRKESIATIHAALDAGVTLFDTGDFYGMGHNELLLADALSGKARDSYQISVKFGSMRDPSGGWNGIDGRPIAVKNSLAYTLKRLKCDYIDVYRLARLDLQVPIEDTIGAIGDMVKAGYVKHVGLSELGIDTIRRAAATHPISDLQIEYSLMARGIEKSILPAIRELGIGITAYGVLARGLLTGTWNKDQLGVNDFRASVPWFEAGNIEINLALIDQLKNIADDKNVTVAQLAVAWVAAQGDDIVPLFGAATPAQVNETVAAMAIDLSREDLALIEAAIPIDKIAGKRSNELQMSIMDSEKI